VTPWPELRERLRAEGDLYQPLEHPDCADWPVKQPCEERWGMIAAAIADFPITDPDPFDQPASTVVDYGAHTGWFCRQFSRGGWQALGIERSAFWLEIAHAMQPWARAPKPWYSCRDILAEAPLPCDVALCLSTAMYLFDDPAIGWRFFRNVSHTAPRLFLDFGGMYADRLPFTEATVVDAMTARTHYTRGRLLGYSDFGARPMFLFER
jgi:hypothetical protein